MIDMYVETIKEILSFVKQPIFLSFFLFSVWFRFIILIIRHSSDSSTSYILSDLKYLFYHIIFKNEFVCDSENCGDNDKCDVCNYCNNCNNCLRNDAFFICKKCINKENNNKFSEYLKEKECKK